MDCCLNGERKIPPEFCCLRQIVVWLVVVATPMVVEDASEGDSVAGVGRNEIRKGKGKEERKGV